MNKMPKPETVTGSTVLPVTSRHPQSPSADGVKFPLSFPGYHGDGLNAVILFASCYLPRSSIPNYTYVMEHLFR